MQDAKYAAAAIAKLEEWREKDPGVRLVILVQLLTGMRFGEIRALEKRDLDFNTPGIWVRRSQARREVGTPKNKRARFQVIPRELAGELRDWMLKTQGQLLFPCVRGGPLPNNSINRMYCRLAEDAGVKPISAHNRAAHSLQGSGADGFSR